MKNRDNVHLHLQAVATVIIANIYTTICLQRVISGAWLPKYISEIQMADFQIFLIVHTQTLVTRASQTHWQTTKQQFDDFGQEQPLEMLQRWLSRLLACQFVTQWRKFNDYHDQYHIMEIIIHLQAILHYNYIYIDHFSFIYLLIFCLVKLIQWSSKSWIHNNQHFKQLFPNVQQQWMKLVLYFYNSREHLHILHFPYSTNYLILTP